MKRLHIMILLIFCLAYCRTSDQNSEESKSGSPIDSIDVIDTVRIQHPDPPYDIEETIIRRRVALEKDSIDVIDSVTSQRPYPPYDFHDTIVKRRIPLKK